MARGGPSTWRFPSLQHSYFSPCRWRPTRTNYKHMEGRNCCSLISPFGPGHGAGACNRHSADREVVDFGGINHYCGDPALSSLGNRSISPLAWPLRVLLGIGAFHARCIGSAKGRWAEGRAEDGATLKQASSEAALSDPLTSSRRRPFWLSSVGANPGCGRRANAPATKQSSN